MEEIDYSVLYRWFVGLDMDDQIWSPTTLSKNRDRLLESDIAAAFFDGVLAQAPRRVCSRTNTSRSMGRCWKPDPDASLARKGQGKEAKLSYAGHVLLDNRHGLVANVCTTRATGTAEREAAQRLLDASAPPRSTVGGDKHLDVRAFVAAVRALEITPHVAQKAGGTPIDGRTTRHPDAISQQKRS
jgi:hypothetical protein